MPPNLKPRSHHYEIKTIEQPENSMEIDILSLQAGFFSQIL